MADNHTAAASETPSKAPARSGGTATRSRSKSTAKRTGPRKGTSRAATSRSRASSNGVHAPMHEMKSDVAALRTDASRLVHGIEGVAVEKLNEITERSRDEIAKTHDKIKEFVGQRPITSVAIALGVGAILARIMR